MIRALGLTVLVHAALVGLVWYGHIADSPRVDRVHDVLVTEVVHLGKPRETFWLPRLVRPPTPTTSEPKILLAQDPNAPTVKRTEQPERRDEAQPSKAAQAVLDRWRPLLRNAVEPREGLPTGATAGRASTATEGDAYATRIHEAIQRNWSVPIGMSIGDVATLQAEVRVAIAEDGQILEPVIMTSSGNSLFDDSCLRAVLATRRLPPPPAALRDQYRRGLVLAFGGKHLVP